MNILAAPDSIAGLCPADPPPDFVVERFHAARRAHLPVQPG